MSTVSCPEYGELQDRLQRLAIARESLSLQVSVLTEQVGAQSEKIKDLESLLEDKRQKLDSTEEVLQGEMSTRTNLETSKLDLMAEVGNLKTRFGELERDKYETEQRLRSAVNEIGVLQKVMTEYKGASTSTAAAVPPNPPPFRQDNMDPADEIDQLRMAVNQLIGANSEKQQHIDQLRGALEQQARISGRYGSVNMQGREEGSSTGGTLPRSVSGYENSTVSVADFDINRQLQKLLLEEEPYMTEEGQVGYIPSSVSYPDNFVYGNTAPGGISNSTSFQTYIGPSLQSSSSYTSSLSAMSGSSPLAWSSGAGTPRHAPIPHQLPPNSPSTPNVLRPVSGSTVAQLPPNSSPAARQLAAELDQLAPDFRRQLFQGGDYYSTGSLPRNFGVHPLRKSASSSSQPGFPKKKKGRGSSGGEWAKPPRAPGIRGLKWLRRRLRPSKRSTSAPNLGDVEDDANVSRSFDYTESDDETIQSSAAAFNEKFKRDKKQRSLRNLFGKVKRSNSQELDGSGGGEEKAFQRGVLTRSSAPRMGSLTWRPSNHSVPTRPPLQLFYQWTAEQIGEWMSEIGLNLYVGDCLRVLRSGRHLITMTQAELEKELMIRNPLHRKLLTLSLRAIENGKTEAHDKMDYHQVLRWLDDIGLPQHRDVFAEARIDGQMLDALTVDDLLHMRISSALNHATLARGIQVLRNLGWNLNRIQRKFNPDVVSQSPCPNLVQLWSQHCVSEWLRSIDLTEYTPNLMCAGIHGALLILEPTFTSESLSDVLRMPAHKTLIRRHLATHFNRLLGPEVIAEKREVLNQSFVVQLGPALKVKPLKKGFSLARKKSKTEVYMEPEELVSPTTPSRPPPSSGISLRNNDPTLSAALSEFVLQNMESSNV